MGRKKACDKLKGLLFRFMVSSVFVNNLLLEIHPNSNFMRNSNQFYEEGQSNKNNNLMHLKYFLKLHDKGRDENERKSIHKWVIIDQLRFLILIMCVFYNRHSPTALIKTRVLL